METVFSILEQFGKPISLVTLCSSTFGAFVFVENMSAAQARADFAQYLKSTDFSRAAARLPNDTRALFERIFGQHHFSWRCIKSSVLCSVISFIIVVGITFLHDPRAFASYLEFMTQYRGILNSFVAYAIWSIIPDYLNLLKTRSIIEFIATHRVSRPSILSLILMVDLLIGYVVFTISVWPIGLLGLHFWLFLIGQVSWNHLVNNFVFSPLSLSYAFELPYGLLFWSGMVPSIWLWFHVVATVIVRLAVRTAPIVRFSIYFLDIEQHPIRSVGVVAAALMGSGYMLIVLCWRVSDILSQSANPS